MRGEQLIFDGPAAPVLALARRTREDIWERRRQASMGLPDAEASARRVTLSELFDRLLDRTAARRRPATVAAYKGHRPVIERAFGHLPLAAIRTADLELWLDGQMRRVAPQTVANYRRVLIRLFNFAIKADLYGWANPAAKTEPIPVPEKQGRQLAEEEATALLEACTGEKRQTLWRAFFATLLLTGMRFLEAVRLRWDDFRWDEDLCVPNHQKASRRQDAIVVTPEWKAVLEPISHGAPSGLVFPSDTGQPLEYATVRKALVRLAKRAGIADPDHIGLHAFRRTAITAAEVAAKGNAMALMRIARHRDTSTTRRYLPALPPETRRVSLRAAKAIGRAIGVVIPLPARRRAAG